MIRRIGLIGDVHAEHARLAAAIEHLQGRNRVDAICCTGDLADGAGDIDACCALLRDADARVVAGNHDRWLLTNRMRNVPLAHSLDAVHESSRDYLGSLPQVLFFDTVAGPALLCHGVAENDMRKVWPGSPRMPIERSAELDELIAEDRLRFVLNGHMHYRVIVNFERLALMNAGTLRGDHRPGVSIVDFEQRAADAFEFDANLHLHRVAERSIDVAGCRVWRDTQEFDGCWTPTTLYAAA